MASKKDDKKLKEPVAQQRSGTRRPPQREIERMRQEKMEQEMLERENVARIVSVVTFALSLLFFFVAVIRGDGAWEWIHNAYIGLFGWIAAIFFPIVCIAYSVLFFNVKRSKRKVIYETVSITIIVLLVSTFIHIVAHQPHEDFLETVKTAFTEAPDKLNGGFFGGVIGWLLLTCGKAPAVIIDLILIFVDGMLLSKLSINDLFNKAKDTAKKATPYIEERRERRQNRNIDVPLDGEVSSSENGEVVDNQKPKKSRTKKAELDVNEDGPGDDAMAEMIKDINSTTKRHQEERNAGKEHKSIDEIVEVASKEEPKPEKKAEPAPEFTVTDEDMQAKVAEYKIPPVSILKEAKKKSSKDISNELKNNAQLLIETLASFGVSAEITDISRGPTVTRYELKPAAGVRISKITNLADDIALNLAATNVRIEAPIPGKAAVGIEIPNSVTNMVSMRELIDTPDFGAQKSLLSAGIGKDIAGKAVFCDIAKMPHLLIAGTTGSGKSVCMNSIIVSILYRATPKDVKLLMIDPKKVEFSKYEGIPHLLVPVVTDPRKASGALGWAVSEMLKRYQMFSDTGVRDIEGYNKYAKKHGDMAPMPKVVICIDELADLMMAAPKEVEDSICRLAQMARAAGMHLVIATQRPSVDVITGLIKANISSRIALTVSSQIDSRTILDTGGAEKLLGRGDMLYSPIGSNKPLRVQGCFISDEEVEELCNFIKTQGESQYSDEIQKEIETKAVQEKGSNPFIDDSEGEALDPLFEKAVDVVLETGRASTSFLQRKLGVGYSRGSKIMDQLEDKGVIGPQDGAKPREIRINKQQWIQMQAQGSVSGDDVDFTAENTEQISFDLEGASDAEVIDNQYFNPLDDIDEE